MRFLTVLAIVAALTFAADTALASCEDGEIVIKFSHVTNTDKHPKGIAASLLEKRVNEEMNGKACIEVFPSSQLYNDDQVLEAMLAGDVQMAAPSLSKFEKFLDLTDGLFAGRLGRPGHQVRKLVDPLVEEMSYFPAYYAVLVGRYG